MRRSGYALVRWRAYTTTGAPVLAKARAGGALWRRAAACRLASSAVDAAQAAPASAPGAAGSGHPVPASTGGGEVAGAQAQAGKSRKDHWRDVPRVSDVLEAHAHVAPTIANTATLKEAIAAAAEHSTHAHVVVDEAGAAVGVFAATDLFKRLDLTLSDEPSTVADFMTPVVAFGWPDMYVHDAIRRLGSSRFRHLPIVADGSEEEMASARSSDRNLGTLAADSPVSRIVGVVSAHEVLEIHMATIRNLEKQVEKERKSRDKDEKERSLRKAQEEKLSKRREQEKASADSDGASEPAQAERAGPAAEEESSDASSSRGQSEEPAQAAEDSGVSDGDATDAEEVEWASNILERVSNTSPSTTVEEVLSRKKSLKKRLLLNTRVEDGVSVLEAMVEMAQHRVGTVLVVDGSRQLVGLCSTRDILRDVLCKGIDPAEVFVEDVMSTEIATVKSNDSIFKAGKILVERSVRHVPVVDPLTSQLLTVLSLSDVVGLLRPHSEKDGTVAQLRRFLQGGNDED